MLRTLTPPWPHHRGDIPFTLEDLALKVDLWNLEERERVSLWIPRLQELGRQRALCGQRLTNEGEKVRKIPRKVKDQKKNGEKGTDNMFHV